MTFGFRPRLLISVAAALFAASSASAKAPEDRQFLPVIVLTSEGDNAGEEVNRQIVESVSAAIRRAVLTTYAEEIYGTGAAFKKRSYRSGPLGIMGRSFQTVDRFIEADLSAGKLGALLSQVSGSSRYWVEVFWVKAPHNLPVVRDRISGAAAIGMLWNMAKATILPESAAIGESIVTGLTDVAVVNSKDLPGGRDALYAQGRAVYDWLITNNQQIFLPMYSAFILDITRNQVGLHLSVNFKPGELNIPLAPPEPEDLISAQILAFQPPHYVPDPAVGRLIMERLYRRGAAGEKPTMKLTFGRMPTSDVRRIEYCLTKCAELDANGGPKHIMKSAPTVPGKMRIPDQLASWVGKRLGTMARADLALVNGYVDLYVLLQELTFDLSDPAGFTVIPEKSRVPLVVRVTDSVGNRKYVDVTQGAYGTNFMQKMVVTKTAAELSETAGEKVKEADANANKSFAEMAEKMKILLR